MSTDINTVVVTFAVSFSPNLAGPLQDHTFIVDNLDYAGLGRWDKQSDGIWNWAVNGGVAPSVQLSVPGYTDLSGFYTTDSFTFVISGSPNAPVSQSINGSAPSVVGSTSPQGSYVSTGNWTNTAPGAYTEVWYVGGLAAPAVSFYLLPPDNSSIPGSFNAPAPVFACDNISGKWDDTIPGVSAQWNLTQTGTSVSGQLVRHVFPNCGTTTYNVTGNYTGSGFSLSASQPNVYDSCGNVLITSFQTTATISGSSCSTAASQYLDTLLGIISPGTSTLTAANPHFNVSYAAYIPVDHIRGPTPCSIVPADYLLYKGDAYRQTYRAKQAILAFPDLAYGLHFFFSTGPTRNYSVGSPANGFSASLDSTPFGDIYTGPYTGRDEDGIPHDCRLWNDSGHADTSNMMTYSVISISPTSSRYVFTGSATNPLEPQLPNVAINWGMSVTIDDTNPNSPTASVTYNHSCYPAHLIKVNGVTVYDSQSLGYPQRNDIGYVAGCLSGNLAHVTGQTAAVTVPRQ